MHSHGRRILPILLCLATLIAGLPANTRAATPSAIAAPVLKWRNGGCFASWCQTGWYSSPAVVDLDGDGSREVVSGSYDVVALNGADGALRWRAANGQRVWPGIAVADLTGDGSPEVVVGRGGDQLTVYSAALVRDSGSRSLIVRLGPFRRAGSRVSGRHIGCFNDWIRRIG